MQRIWFKSTQKNKVEIIIKRILPVERNILFFRKKFWLKKEPTHKLSAYVSRFDFQDDRHFFHIDGNANFDKRLVSVSVI